MVMGVKNANSTRLVLLLTGAIIPIPWSIHFEALFITPPLLGSRHNIPYLQNIFTMPTRGQSLFIAYQITINVILCGMGIESARQAPGSKIPRAKSSHTSVTAPTCTVSPISRSSCSSSRNNVLLWVTNWSHGTFLLLHRWIAVIAVVEACLHSALGYLSPDL
jgi:hypothetical protein